MVISKLESPIQQLKGVNEILKDESFLYSYRETIRKFFSNRGNMKHKKGWHSSYPNESYTSTKIFKSDYYLVISYNLVTGKIDLYDTLYENKALSKSKFFDTILVGILKFEDFILAFNKDEDLIYFNKDFRTSKNTEEYFCVDVDKVITKIYQRISKDYKRNLKNLLVDKPDSLKYSSKFKGTDVFPFQFLGDLEQQLRYFEFNCSHLLDENGNLREDGEHLRFIYEKYKEKGLNELMDGSSSFEDLYRYCKRFSLDLNSSVETYSESILREDISNFKNGKSNFNNARLFHAVSSAFKYTTLTTDDKEPQKILIKKTFEYIKECQSNNTDIDLIGDKDFDISNYLRRQQLSEFFVEYIDDYFCLNVSLFEANYPNLDKQQVFEHLDDSIGNLLESGSMIKIRLLTQRSVSYCGEFKSLVSVTDQSGYIFEWLKNLSDNKKELVSFHKNEVEAIEVLINNGILKTNILDVVEFLKSFN
jgi:hypothetical protein